MITIKSLDILNGQSMVSLEIYVETGCLTCRRSLSLAREVQRLFPEVSVEVIDVSSAAGRHRHLVRATPTFILDGVTISLGNPSEAALERAITHVLARRRTHEPQV